ncbi:MAG TPA: hypothetical protein PKZ41_00215, partial [Candidatus Omnitrophota bacterium]|nr:hypothetical protein [Candidatus Omnitrophota bacterium]
MLYSLENAPGKGAIFEEKSADDEGIVLNALTFSIPEHLGIVNDRWQGSSSPVVIYVQDAHCNYEAQQKLSQIVAYVNEKYGIETVDLEGGAGGYDLSALTDVADPVSRRNIADFFVKEGLVNGAEYFAANNPEKVRLWGVEDRELYMENLGVYRDSLAYREKAKGHIAELKRVIGKFKEKMYSPELLLVDEKRGEFRKNDVELAEYMAFIFGEAENNSVDISAYPNISMLKKISDKESSIDFRKADKEKDQLVDRLKRALSKRSMEELLRWTIDLKAERMSQGEYYRRLLETARKVNVPVEDLSQLGEYVEYMSMFDSVDKSAAMKELEALDGAIREKLYKGDGERELDELSRDLEILERIFDISLVKSEYRYYMDNSGDFDVARYQSFISKYATLYGMEAAFNKEIFSLDDYRGRMIRFFEYSFRRDDAFLKNLSVRRSGGASPEAAILVTGGFHSENLCELFRNNNISYVSVMPNFRSPAGYESPYFARLAGGGSVVSVLEPAVTAASAMQVASLFSGIARDVWGDNADKSIRAAVKVMEMRGVEYLSGISKVEYADGKFTFTMKSGEEDEWSREESAELKGETLGRSSAMDIGEGVLPFRLYSWENKGDSIFSGDVSAGEIKQLVRGASSIPFVVVGEEIVDPVSGKTRIGLKEILFGSPGMAHGSMLEIYTAGKEDIPFYIGFLSQGSAVFSEKSGIPRDLKDLVTNMLLEEDLIDSGYVIAEQEERTLLFVDPFSGQAMEFNAENSKTHDDILKEFSSQLKTGLKDLSSSNMPSNNLWNMLGYDPASERHRQVIEKLQDWARQSERDQEVLSIEGIIDFYHVSTGFSHDGEKVVTVQLPAFEGWYGIFAASNRELYSKLLEYAEGARLVENFYDESKSGKRSLVDLPSV